MRSNLPLMKRENRNDFYWARDLVVNGITVGRGKGNITTNSVFGTQALYSNTTGIQNTANGYQALRFNTTGSSNTANGNGALYSNTTGSNNTANGYYALYSNTTGTQNTANGNQALQANTTGSNNTANGYQALVSNTTGTQNTANGIQALQANTTGSNNTANGYYALRSNTTGTQNTANGYYALYSNTTGTQNTANGYFALYSNTTGSQNTANGYYALYLQKGYTLTAGNFIIGNSYTILTVGTTSFIAIGAANNNVGTVFTATGVGSGTGTATLNNQNVAEGYQSAYSNVVGANNVSLGTNSLYTNSKTTTAGAFIVGSSYTILTAGTTDFTLIGAANSLVGTVFTATGVGSGTGTAAGNASNNTALGYQALYANEVYLNVTGVGANTAVTGSNQVQLGDSATTTYAYGAIQDRSDIRDKADVRDTTLGLAFIESLRPVDFKWDKREDYRTLPPIKPAYLEKPAYPERVDSLQLEDESGEDYQTRVDAEFKVITDEVDARYEADKAVIDAEFSIIHDAWLETNKLANITHDGSKKRNRYHHGVIAQEVPAEFGGLQNHALKGGDDVWSVGYEEFIAPLIKAVQELSVENKLLKAHLGL